MEKITNTDSLVEGEYYRINGTKKKLYWMNGEWFKPQKDIRGGYSGYLQRLPEQPVFKFAEKIELTDLYE